MRTSASSRFFAVAVAVCFAIACLCANTAAAQQVTYYDFDVPQSVPAQTSYQCSPASLAASASGTLFCFSNVYGLATTPSYLSDTYPASIDPVTTDNPPVAGTHYAVQMTPSTQTQGSSLWFAVPQKVSSGFTAYFAFKFTPDPTSYATADGLAFVVQNSAGGGSAMNSDNTSCAATGAGPSIVGAIGGCIGYGGIDNSLAIEFDTYRNAWDPADFPNATTQLNNDNHIAIQNCGPGLPNSPDHTGTCLAQLNNGTLPGITSLLNGVAMADGNVHQVVINYSGPAESTPNLLQIFIDPPFNAGTHTPAPSAVPVLSGTYNLASGINLLNSGTANDSAYVGFTSATGAAFEQHELMAWTFTPHTSVTQTQPIQQNGQPTVFPFGSHVYAATYPATTPTSGINMVVTANTITPQFFSQLINAGPFTGSQCQVYDETGGNCIVYSVSCTSAATGAVVQCPVTDQADFIQVKSAYNNSIAAVTPGYLQGDPLYNLVSTVTGDGTTATVTCAGECSVTPGQTVTVAGTLTGGNPSGFNGTVTVVTANTATPNIFSFASAVSGSATGGYLTSGNVQNIFTSYSPQRIDATTTGKTHNFSDLVVTAVTSSQTGLTITAPTTAAPYGSPVTVTVTAMSPNGPPPGSVTLSVDGGTPLTQPLAPATPLNTSTAVFALTGLGAGPHSLLASYTTNGAFLANTATGAFTVSAPTPAVTLSSNNLNFGTLYLGSIGTQGVTLTNTGAAPLVLKTPFIQDVGNGDSKEFLAVNLCPGTLAVGKSCSIFVLFVAGPAYNPQTAILEIMDNAPNSPQPVNLTALVINPLATFSARSVAFGTQSVSAKTQSILMLKNTGATLLTLSSFSITGAASADYSQTNNCPAALQSNAGCSITLTFTPSKTGARSATLTVTDNAQNSPQQIPLSGTGK